MFRRILITALLAGFSRGVWVFPWFRNLPPRRLSTTPRSLNQRASPAVINTGISTKRRIPFCIWRRQSKRPPRNMKPGRPPAGLERTVYSTLANIIAGIGFALILVACIALTGRPVDGRAGVLWGIAGFAAINLAPALGLPPEVPGAMAAELGARQGWWMLCVAATATGLWMLIFRHGAIWVIAGIVTMALPHLIGAPQPVRIGGPVPPELAGHFVAASLVTAAIFWCALGWLSGTFWQRLGAK